MNDGQIPDLAQVSRGLFAGSDRQPTTGFLVEWAEQGPDLFSTYHETVRDLAREAEEAADEAAVQVAYLVREASARLEEIPQERHDLLRRLHDAERERARVVYYAAGRGRSNWEKESGTVTDRMEEARDRLDPTVERLEELRSEADQLESEYEALATVLGRFSILVPSRRQRRGLKDRDDVLNSFGSRPSPGALVYQDQVHGWA